MIWLSPMAGTEECSVYFDIRDIGVRRTGSTTEGVVSGIIGDGSCELWGEVTLGEKSQVNILPFWDEGEPPGSLDEAIDLASLKTQLAEAVARVFSGIGQLTAGERFSGGGFWSTPGPVRIQAVT